MNDKYIENIVNYKTLKKAIFRLKLKIKELQDERQYIINYAGPGDVKAQTYDLKSKGSRRSENVNELYEKIGNLQQEINTQKFKLYKLEEAKEGLERSLTNKLNSTEKIVFVLYYIKELNTFDIAVELNKNYQHIRRVKANIDKKVKKWIKIKKSA